MSANHRERIERVVDKALKEAAMGEPYGFVISPPAFWPFLGPKGQVTGQGPAWFVVVTIRATALTEPDIYQGHPVPGFLPIDDDFRTVAQELLKLCLKERATKDAQAFAAGPSMKLTERPRS